MRWRSCFPVYRVAKVHRSVRIALLTHTFPSISQTFVLNQVTGLLHRGHDVQAFPIVSETGAVVHADVAGFGLMQRTHVPLPVTGKRARWLQAACALPSCLRISPRATFQAFDWRTHGLELASGKSLLEVDFWSKQNGQFDIILCHFGPSGSRAVRLREAGLITGKIVTMFHAYDLTRHVQIHGKQTYDALFQRGDLFLPITNYAKSKLLELGAPPTKTEVHAMGVDCARLAPDGSRSKRASAPLRLLLIGRLVEKKGVGVALDSISNLVGSGVQVTLDVLGDGPLRAPLQEQIHSLGLQDSVIMRGAASQETVRNYLSKADILLVPSVTAADGDEEGLPVVIMEAMAMGKAVVATRHAGIPELVEHEQTGLLVPERDTQALVDALARLEQDRGLMAKIGRTGRQRVEQSFNIERLNDGLERRLLELCS